MTIEWNGMRILRLASLFVLFLSIDLLEAQDYHWPTDASQNITSSFAEYRPGRFHAGVDIKTWSRTGYKVYAVDDGYVWRIWVSPFGYGRAVYLKLKDGKVVVYAHLKGFAEELERRVKLQQRKIGRFSIQLYFKPNEINVQKGELIAYTGKTGVGAPHLHFEMRDAKNHPINPLKNGFSVEDTIPPQLVKFAVMPLDYSSEINGDCEPLVLNLNRGEKNGTYELSEPIQVKGKVGLSLSAYDQANGATNGFSIYELTLLIDGQEIWRSQYDKFSYERNYQSLLDRNYRLLSRGQGIFYNLFRKEGNELPFYGDNAMESGVLLGVPQPGEVGVSTKADDVLSIRNLFGSYLKNSTKLSEENLQTGNVTVLNYGIHSFNVVARDVYGNESALDGKLIVGELPKITSVDMMERDDRLDFFVEFDDPNVKLETVECRYSFGTEKDPGYLPLGEEKDSFYRLREILGNKVRHFTSSWRRGDLSEIKFFELVAMDSLGLNSPPKFYFVEKNNGFDTKQDLNLDATFYNDYFRVQVSAEKAVQNEPVVFVRLKNQGGERLRLSPKNISTYVGKYRLTDDVTGMLRVSVLEEPNRDDDVVSKEYLINLIHPGTGGSVTSNDKLCEIVFNKNSVYMKMFTWIEYDTTNSGSEHQLESMVYRLNPFDVPLKRSVMLKINFPSDEAQPEKLAIYYKAQNGNDDLHWEFVGNKLSLKNEQIVGKIKGFGSFALLRDDVPPRVKWLYPKAGSHISNLRPMIRIGIGDDLAGIASDNDIEMWLDGKKLIAEYDPEDSVVFYRPEQPLSEARHKLTVKVKDQSNNIAEKSTYFWLN